MYVRVHYLNKIYYSYVFMHFEVDYMPHVVVYDSIDNKFEVVSVLSKSIDGVRQVGYMNEKEKKCCKSIKRLPNSLFQREFGGAF